MTAAAPTATTTHGRVRGEQVAGVQRYLGIPYAADPIGALRLRPPAPPPPWGGVRDCLSPSPAPPQPRDPVLEDVIGAEAPVTGERGCLTVNVWTPATTGRRPVMVWIHGGSYVQGSGFQVWTDGARLAARHDVVVVSLNYRLGALGWLYVPRLLGGESGEPERYAASANLGLQDQIAALTWVRDNIGRFGGDARSVTVFGESAGGGCVAALLGAPAARPLFHRAILQSPNAGALRSREEAGEVAEEFAAVLRETSGEPTADIRSASAAQLLTAQDELARRYTTRTIPFTPVVDGAVLPLPPVRALREGAGAHVPVLAGTNEHEARPSTCLGPPVPPAVFEEALTALFPDPALAARARSLYEAYEAYEGPPAGDASYAMAALFTDLVFRSPTDALLDAHAAGGGAAWSYLFREPTPVLGGGLGAAHTLDLPYVFDVLDGPGIRSWVGDTAPQRLADAMSGAWAHFARHGVPASELLPPWPRFTPEERPTMALGGAAPGVVSDPLGDRRRLWQDRTPTP